MNENWESVKMLARFPFGLRHFLNQLLTIDDARHIIRQGIAKRDENFIAVLERHVYGNPKSPYRTLLEWADCELGDIRAMVRDKGLEETLSALREAGVYVTFEEVKGREPIVRDGRTLAVKPSDFDNPDQKRIFATESSGSTGAPERVSTDFARLRARLPHTLLTTHAHGMDNAPEIIWRGILPDSTISSVLIRALIGPRVIHWYTNIGWRDSKYWLKYDAATLYMLFWMNLMGARIPFPQFVAVDNPAVIARALGEALKRYGKCSFHSMVSRALRVCASAQEQNIDLTGVSIIAGGEPPTPAKVRQMERAGARFFPNYASSGAGTLGNGCAHPIDENDIHFFKDLHALITFPHRVEGFDVTVPAFHLTSLTLSSAKIYLNAQMDDYGIVEERACGCEFEAWGYTTHLRAIRSYRKLTGEGVTLIGSEMLNVLEETLPARFGGTPLDYQLVEEEDERGLTRLSILVHPRLDNINEEQVVQVTLNALGAASPMADAARSVWQQAGTLRVKRRAPIWNARGKLMPLHIERQSHSTQSSDGGNA